MTAARYLGGPLDGRHDEIPDDCITVGVEGDPEPGWHYLRIDDRLLWMPDASFQRKETCNWRNNA